MTETTVFRDYSQLESENRENFIREPFIFEKYSNLQKWSKKENIVLKN